MKKKLYEIYIECVRGILNKAYIKKRYSTFTYKISTFYDKITNKYHKLYDEDYKRAEEAIKID